MSTVLNDHADALRDTLIQAGQELVSFAFDISRDPSPVRVGPQSLETALINLVINAREAMPRGGRVTVSLRNVDDLARAGGDSHRPGTALSASDEGDGIVPEGIPRILEPFYTTNENAWIGPHPGRGLCQTVRRLRRD